MSLSFKADGTRLIFTSDVARADGQLVADGPSASEGPEANRERWVGEQVAVALAFFRSQEEAIRSEL